MLAPLLIGGLLEAHTSLTFLRYLLPAFPLVCVSISRVAAPLAGPRAFRRLAVCFLVPTLALPLLQHPRYLGYFNVALGGPATAWPWFSDGEIDWGQGLPALRVWQTAHPGARPIRLALFSPLSPPYVGLTDDTPDLDDGTTLRWVVSSMPRVPRAPVEGYLAISVTLLNRIAADGLKRADSSAEAAFCRWLKARPPLAMIGSSILIFYFSAADVQAWSRRAIAAAK